MYASTRSVRDFVNGDPVRYVPGHAHGDIRHRDCENGVVTSSNDRFVFVCFGRPGTTSQACDPRHLVIMSGGPRQ